VACFTICVAVMIFVDMSMTTHVLSVFIDGTQNSRIENVEKLELKRGINAEK
jgi:hypothetical protein